MSSAREEQDPLNKSQDEAVRNMLGMGSEDPPAAAGELLFDEYEDGRSVDDLLGIVRESADDAPDHSSADSGSGTAVEMNADFDEDLIFFEEDDQENCSSPTEIPNADAADTETTPVFDDNDDEVLFADDFDDSEDPFEDLTPAADPAPRPAKSPATPKPASDDSYWNELDRWVWDDETAESANSDAESANSDEESANSDEESASHENDAELTTTDSEISPDNRSDVAKDDTEDSGRPRRRRRGRRGRRGRGRNRQETDSGSEAGIDSPVHSDDDDLSEILFEEASEDFVSVSQEEAPPSQSEHHPLGSNDTEDADVFQDESDSSEESRERSRRGRRGGRHRRSRRSKSSSEGQVAAEINLNKEENEDPLDEAPFDFRDSEDDAQPQRKPTRRRPPAQRDSDDDQLDADRSRRSRSDAKRSDTEQESPRRTSRRERGAASEFRKIPSWEEVIAALSIKSPGTDHADRRSSRGRGSRRRRT